MQAKLRLIDLAEGHPHSLCGVVGRRCDAIVIHVQSEEQVQRMDGHARILVEVRNAKQVLGAVQLQSGLLFNLA